MPRADRGPMPTFAPRRRAARGRPPSSPRPPRRPPTPHRQHALRGRPGRPLPASAATGCSASTPPTGPQAALHAHDVTAGWTTATVPNAWNATDTSNESMAASIGWYRKDFHAAGRQHALRLGAALRVGQLPRAYSTQRPAASASTPAPTSRSRSASRRLPEAPRHQPARRPRRLRAGARPTSRRAGLTPRATADRRLVELRRHPARGLPPQGRPHRLQHVVRCGPSCRASSCARRSLLRTTVRNASSSTQRVRVDRHVRRRATSAWAPRTSAPTTSRRSPSASPSSPAAVGAGSPTLYTRDVRRPRRRARRSPAGT